MADGTYERRGPREAELKRLKRILDEAKAKKALKNDIICGQLAEKTPKGSRQ